MEAGDAGRTACSYADCRVNRVREIAVSRCCSGEERLSEVVRKKNVYQEVEGLSE